VYLWFCGFNAKFLALQLSLVHSIMRLITIGLTLPYDYFDSVHHNPDVTMRLLHLT
jgi:isopenicillin N synthase-like dioxygenase